MEGAPSTSEPEAGAGVCDGTVPRRLERTSGEERGNRPREPKFITEN